MTIQAYGLSDVGRERSANEDAYLCDPSIGLFVVCDGMGGHAAGEVASAHTVKTLEGAVRGNLAQIEAVASGRAPVDGLAALMREAVEGACAEIFEQASQNAATRGMGTTCTALLVAGGKGVLAHVGDSRLLMLRGGQVTQLTQDHTYVAEAIRRGMLRPEDADKSPFGNVVTRAVGPQRNVIVDTLVFDLVPGDTLLLCSDGLHQYTPDPNEMGRVMANANLEAMAGQFIGIANQRGGSDNITAVVARVPSQASSGAGKKQLEVVTDIDALRHIEVMRELNMAEVVRLCQAFRSVRYEPGEFVIREGEVTETFFVMVEGSAEVLRGTERIAALPKGSHFGEMALLSLRPRSATVRATSPCRMLVSDRQTLYAFLQQDQALAAKFFWKLAQTLSMRLDEVYVARAATPDAAAQPGVKDTLRFGHYPVPYQKG